ncbi:MULTISPECIES: hypothetical protein [Aeromonas]|uniref:Uncharacterized protein n=1 Tax=Aeromonas veronii TaxID=654 RepID=A0A4S5CKZ4_AERVE|nr:MULTISPECIES: hypothetical protein [Aeromonas]THJ45065.1 hypothetical protein E8Q35_12850 [Aeromonas veronii]
MGDDDSWIDANTLPKCDGDYECRISNNGREFTAKRRFKKRYWFGGCRPFADADIVLAWRELDAASVTATPSK